MTNRLGPFALLVLLSPTSVLAQAHQVCENLRSLSFANTTITTSIVVTGSFTPPGSSNPNATIANLPSFCRVAATLRPTADSEIPTCSRFSRAAGRC
jgi:feruloyl esterase